MCVGRIKRLEEQLEESTSRVKELEVTEKKGKERGREGGGERDGGRGRGREGGRARERERERERERSYCKHTFSQLTGTLILLVDTSCCNCGFSSYASRAS